MTIKKHVLYVASVIFFCMCINAVAEDNEGNYKKFGKGTVELLKQKITIQVEVATTKIQRAIGLMFREYLAPDSGMLFVFEENGSQKVWMKNTLIPLDVIFISEHGEIVTIINNLQPCKQVLCEIQESKGAAKYMLEINSGMIEEKMIKVGEKALFYL